MLGSAPVNHSILAQPAQLAEEQRRWTKARKNRLDEIEPHKCAEDEPPRTTEIGKGRTGQANGAGKETNECFDFHVIYFI